MPNYCSGEAYRRKRPFEIFIRMKNIQVMLLNNLLTAKIKRSLKLKLTISITVLLRGSRFILPIGGIIFFHINLYSR